MIDLTWLPLRVRAPRAQLFGGQLTPPTGGPTQTIERLGDRWSLRCETPTMDWEPDGRRVSALLRQAQREGARVAIPQPSFDVGAPGAPVAAADVVSGRMLAVSGLTPGYAVRVGQWVTIVGPGGRYADQVIEQTIANGAGAASLRLANLLRAPIPAGSRIDIVKPTIEGSVTDYEEPAVDTDETATFGFTILEDA